MAGPWVSDQVALYQQGLTGGLAIAGVAGSPQFARATELRGIGKVFHFTINLATPNPAPGIAAGAVVQGDVITLAQLKPSDRIYFGRVYESALWGVGVTVSFGKRDNNNAANTDPAHYLAASTFNATAGTSYDFNLNMCEQVGVDPIGDQTVGQRLPQFGSNTIDITATVGGAAPNATGTMNGFIIVVEEGN